jgi:hypothetical protein
LNRGWLIFMWAVIGAVVGQLLGAALAPQLPLLDKFIGLGFDPTRVDLNFVVITLGIQLKLSVAGAIGLVLSMWLALRSS